ncbi:MAG TPA: Gfo/Idh/MocA family oxidoreductase [Alphaproteobacteria bacterium]|jgi:predicted dehydrogenase|nr:Gfo/Idh/MocA family oxidoreductase [Alphaproteobacteria bacterium]HJM51504.1 Gfo/Idh/MocA family oxidoreductase [Alphaproteobacteria bacterium]
MLNVGFIGYRNHAARLLQVVEEWPAAAVRKIFHPSKTGPDLRRTKAFDSLLDCDCIFLCSPNDSHFEYVERLKDYEGYVFCEKPPFASLQEIDRFAFDPGRIFFNFNHRFGLLSEILAAPDKHELGELLFADATVTHGLAYKDQYPGSWRSDIARHPNGVLETVAIHHIDLFLYHLGDLRDFDFRISNSAGTGSAPDTSFATLHFESGSHATVRSSYAAPHVDSTTLVFANGTVEQIDNTVTLYGPRNTFDDRGLFTAPPVRHRWQGDDLDLYLQSLRNSVFFFLETCANRGRFADRLARISLLSNRLILERAG